ncbi:MAG: tetratricopeptide repeat protein [Acidobacteriota bacterium]
MSSTSRFRFPPTSSVTRSLPASSRRASVRSIPARPRIGLLVSGLLALALLTSGCGAGPASEPSSPGPPRPDDAPRVEAELRASLEREPDSVPHLRRLAALLEAQGRRDEAAAVFGRLLRADPEAEGVHLRLASLALLAGDDEGARRHLDLAHSGAPLPGALAAAFSEVEPVLVSPIRGLGDPPVRVDAGGGAQAAETSISGRGPVLVAAWNDQREPGSNGYWRLGGALSRDGGATWSEGLIRPGNNIPDIHEGDPMSAYDPRTGNLWVGGVRFFGGGNVYVARLRPGASAFDTAVVAATPNIVVDKPLMTAGPAPGNPNATRLYIAYSGGLEASANLGTTWNHLDDLAGIDEASYHPRVNADGALFLTSWDWTDGIWLRRSFDGINLEARRRIATRTDYWSTQDATRVPGNFRAPPLPVLAIDPDGDLVVVYCDTASIFGGETDLDLYLIRSSDDGLTWTAPRSLHPSDSGDQVAPWLEIDDGGRLHLVYYDTRYHPQSDADPVGLVDVTYAYSDDGGVTWFESRLTDTPTATDDTDWGGYEFLGDYLGLTTLGDGGAMALYAAAPGGGDLDVYAQRVGPGLFRDGFESGGTGAWSSVLP